MRILSLLTAIGSLAYGYYWVEHNHPSWKRKALAMVTQSEFNTLELHFTADQIMDRHRSELLKDKTREGLLL